LCFEERADAGKEKFRLHVRALEMVLNPEIALENLLRAQMAANQNPPRRTTYPLYP
jgi:hypothetical protein